MQTKNIFIYLVDCDSIKLIYNKIFVKNYNTFTHGKEVIIIKNKKLLLSLSVFFIAFLFTGCFPTTNTAPVIITSSLPNAIIGTAYTYTIEAVDPEEDTLEFSLLAHPTDMTINSTTGVITWTPAAAGSFEITVKVSDGNNSTTQSFTIIVDGAKLTSVVVLPSSMTLKIGESKPITSVTAHYNNGTSAGITLTACTYESNSTNVTVANGVITVSASCSAITVSYTENDVTRSDTVTVTVPSSGG